MAREDPDSIEVRQLILMSVADGSGLEECAGYSTGVPGRPRALDKSSATGLEELFRPRRLNGRCRFRRYVRGAVGRRPALDAQ